MLVTKLGVYSENIRNGTQEGSAREGMYSDIKVTQGFIAYTILIPACFAFPFIVIRVINPKRK